MFAGQTVQDLNQDFFGVAQQAETSQAAMITSGGNLNITSATLNNNGSLPGKMPISSPPAL
jgi:filamentous hemagglutinin